MARQIHGLVGRGVGPVMHVEQGATVLKANVAGLPAGQAAFVTCVYETEQFTHRIEQNGDTDIPVASKAYFEYAGTGLPIFSLKVSR